MTAAKSWGPTLTEKVRREVENQVAAPTEREHPPCTERISLTKECEWKDGDRGGLAEWKQAERNKKAKVCLDIDRPSHGRTFGNALLGCRLHVFDETRQITTLALSVCIHATLLARLFCSIFRSFCADTNFREG